MIIGHKRQFEYLKKVYERGTFAHAYLFFGPEHVGKLQVAKEWIKLFFDSEDGSRIDGNMHPDLIYLAKDKLLKSDNQKEIGIEDITELRRLATLSAYAGGYKFIIIDGADDMSEHAENSLLKILEEPPTKTVFILITDSVEGLFSTTASRTVPIEFFFVNEDDLNSFLDETRVSSSKKEKILAISSGRPGIAISAVNSEEFFEKEWKNYEIFKNIFHSDILNQFLYSQKIYQEPEAVEKLIYFFLSDLRNKMILGENQKQVVGSLKYVFDCLDLVKHTNVNKRLLIDNLFLNL